MVNLNVGRIRELMQSKAKSAKDLAYGMGVSPDLLKRLLDRGSADVYYAMRMSHALDVPIIEITVA